MSLTMSEKQKYFAKIRNDIYQIIIKYKCCNLTATDKIISLIESDYNLTRRRK